VDEPGAAGHGPGDAQHALVRPGEAHQGLAEHVLVVGRRARFGGFALAGGGVVGAGPVEFFGGLDGGGQAAALLGEDVQQDGLVAGLGELEVVGELVEVVAVDGADVAQAEFFEEGGLHEEVLGLALPLHVHAVHVVPTGQTGEEALQVAVDLVVGGVGGEAVEVVGDGADVAGDGPLVVVEDDDEALGGGHDVVEGLEGDAAGEGGVAADGDHMLVAAPQVTGGGHAEGGAEGGAGVARAEGVVLALGPVEKAAGAVRLAQLAEEGAVAAGEQLVHVTLVGDVEDELVARRVEDPVEGEGELDDAEVGSHVTALLRGDGDDFVADFLGELRQRLGRQGLEVGGTAEGRKERGGRDGGGIVHDAEGRRRVSGVGRVVGGERSEGGGAVTGLFVVFDFEFGLLEAGFAHFEQAVAIFKLGEQFGQGHVAGFHRFHDGLQAGEGILKGG
jgi:hypothetical protein